MTDGIRDMWGKFWSPTTTESEAADLYEEIVTAMATEMRRRSTPPPIIHDTFYRQVAD